MTNVNNYTFEREMTETVSPSPQHSSLDIPQEIDNNRIIQQLADELSVKVSQVSAAVGLLDEGSTVPFIARYRKEVTGGLDEEQIRAIYTEWDYGQRRKKN